MSGDAKFNREDFKALLIAGDEEAWGELYLHIKSRLVRFIVHRLGGGAGYQPEAKEIFHDVFFKAFKSYRGEGSPIGFLFKLATRAAINHRKKRKGHDELPEDLPDRQSNPEITYEKEERKEVVKSLIEGLRPGKLKEVLKLSLEGLKNCEIAEMLGISANYVGVCLNRGIKKLRERNGDRAKKMRECRWRDISVGEGPDGKCVVKRVQGDVARMKPRPEADDIVVKVADNPVSNVRAFAQITKEVEASKDVILIVIRVKARDEKKVEITLPGARNGNGRSFSRKLP